VIRVTTAHKSPKWLCLRSAAAGKTRLGSPKKTRAKGKPANERITKNTEKKEN